jgi:glucose/arabinose dehydrogenase
MGIVVAPDYARSRAVYVMATSRPAWFDTTPSLFARATRRVLDGLGARRLEARTGLATEVLALTDSGTRGGAPRSVTGRIAANYYHAGGALLVAPDSAIHASFGDAMHPALAGDPREGIASVRLVVAGAADDASAPFASGLRNVQGLATHPRTGELFAIDHGPTGMAQEGGLAGHDELNVLRRGGWYGWGTPPAGVKAAGALPPVGVWRRAIAPAGLAFAPPSWGEDQLLVTGLRSGALHRLQLGRNASGGWRVTGEERLLEGYGRLRALAVDATGAVWVGTSNADGRGVERPGGDLLLRLRVRK